MLAAAVAPAAAPALVPRQRQRVVAAPPAAAAPGSSRHCTSVLSTCSTSTPCSSSSSSDSSSVVASRRYRERAGGRRQRRRAAVVASAAPAAAAGPAATAEALEQEVLRLLQGAVGRGAGGLSEATLARLDAAVAQLEASCEQGGGGVRDPTASGPLLDGKWRLLFTSRPGTASPIQRAFVGTDAFRVYQEVSLRDPAAPARVSNVVEFGERVGVLRVEAEASTESRPLPGFTPRAGKGLPFGLLGVSSSAPPPRPNTRIDFAFDNAFFKFAFLPFTIPYPVPFRLLGDERKGWIDVTYLSASGRFRLSRGNKGTLFILAKDDGDDDSGGGGGSAA